MNECVLLKYCKGRACKAESTLKKKQKNKKKQNMNKHFKLECNGFTLQNGSAGSWIRIASSRIRKVEKHIMTSYSWKYAYVSKTDVKW